MVSIIDYWREISLATGAVVSFIVGRKSTKLIEKKQQSDAISSMQQTYDLFLLHYEKQYELLQKQYTEVINSNSKITEDFNKIRKQFVDLQLAYSREIEISQNWEKLHRELEKQYRDLEKKYDSLANRYKESEKKHEDLEKLYEKLKADFEKYRKISK